MGYIMPFVSGVRPTGLFFWSDAVVVCSRHRRGIMLQPVTSWDQENGYGISDCPFCFGGSLYGQYHKYRSRRALAAILDSLGG